MHPGPGPLPLPEPVRSATGPGRPPPGPGRRGSAASVITAAARSLREPGPQAHCESDRPSGRPPCRNGP
eukprot:739569-Hanusia_phi.AAC.1